MRTVEFALPSLPVEKWAEFEKLYEVPRTEVELMESSAAAGQRGHLTAEEFVAIARWKSPRPTNRYKQNSERTVREVTTTAFASDNDVEKVLELTRLAGINVRAATAILHLCFPKQYPLLDIRAMAGLGLGDDELKDWGELHWLRVWRPYIVVCRKLSSELGWDDLRRTDRALWAKGRSEARSRMAKRKEVPHAFTATPGGKCSVYGRPERTTAHATFERFTDQPCMVVVKGSDAAAGDS